MIWDEGKQTFKYLLKKPVLKISLCLSLPYVPSKKRYKAKLEIPETVGLIIPRKLQLFPDDSIKESFGELLPVFQRPK